MTNIQIAYPTIPCDAKEVFSPNVLNDSESSVGNTFGQSASEYISTFPGLPFSNDCMMISYDMGAGNTEAVNYFFLDKAAEIASGSTGFALRSMSAGYNLPSRTFKDRLAGWWRGNLGVNFPSFVSHSISAWSDSSKYKFLAAQSTAGNKPIVSRCDDRQNLLLYSEALDNPAWSATRASITANALSTFPVSASDVAYHEDIGGPDKLVEDASVAATHLIAQVVNTQKNGIDYVFSVYAKAAERSKIRLLLSGTSFPATPESTFTLSGSGSTSGTVGCTPTITALSDGWYRCSITASCTVNGNCQTIMYLNNGASASYTGDGVSGLYIWGAQFRESDSSSDYVYTYGLQKFHGINGNRAIRFSDTDVLTTSADLPISGDFAIFAVIRLKATTDATTNYTILNDEVLNTSGLMLRLNGSPGPTLKVFLRTNQAGANTTLLSSQSVAINTTCIISVVFSAGTATIYKNGVSIGSGAVTAPVRPTTGALTISHATEPFQGDMGEIIVVNGTVTGGEHTSIVNYLTDQYLTAPILNEKNIWNTPRVGNQSNHYLNTSVSGSASRFWAINFYSVPDVNTSSDGEGTNLYGIYFGTSIDPGVEINDSDIELIAPSDDLFRSGSGEVYQTRNKVPFHKIQLEWRGVSDSIMSFIQDRIVSRLPSIPLIIFTTTYHEALDSLNAIHIDATKFECSKDEIADYNIVKIEANEFS